MLRIRFNRFIKIMLILTASVFALNAAIIYFAHPGNVQGTMNPSSKAEVGGVKIESYNELRSGGIHAVGATMHTQGYVDMLSPELVVYVNNVDAKDVRYSNLYRHELAHIHQKEMIAHASGGYPSYFNPIQSAKYYYNLVRLNNDLKAAMPKIGETRGVTFVSEGLEAAADCYAQPPSESSKEAVFYSAGYVEHGHCTAVQRRNAIKLVTTEKWFKPMTKAEEAEIPEENITDLIEPFDLKMLQIVGALQEDFASLTEQQMKEALEELEANELNAAKAVKKASKFADAEPSTP